MSSQGTFALEVVSIREHGVTCKFTDEPEGAFATLPKATVTDVLSGVGKALAPGETVFITLSGTDPRGATEDSSLEMETASIHVAGGGGEGRHAHESGNRA